MNKNNKNSDDIEMRRRASIGMKVCVIWYEEKRQL